jgi:N-acetyl-gamma-glutamyl-phosphate reductase
MSHPGIDVAICGAAGYGGQELLRLLAGHPVFRVVAVTSNAHADREVDEVLPQLRGFYDDLIFQGREIMLPDGCAAAFLATPHGAARPLYTQLAKRHPDLAVVDLSQDFRIDGAGKFVYGFTEGNRTAIAESSWVANPGCFATGALLALAPLAANGLIEGDITLAQVTGSSGSGAEPKDTTHHPERAQDMRAYKVMTHQHQVEIVQELTRLGSSDFDLVMIPQSGPFSRGIFTSAHLRVDPAVDVEALYREHYAREFFVRFRPHTPALRHVVRSNFCDLTVHRKGERVVILTAIDNLVKGMAGQAIQNMNLVFGLEETTGLALPGANP